LSLVVVIAILKTRVNALVLSALTLAILAWLALVALGLVSSMLRLYEGVLGVGDGLVIASKGFSPLTSLVYRGDVEQKLSGISGLTVEYHLVSPVLVEGRLLVVRGVEDLEGEDCVLIPREVMRELNISVGDRLLVSSVFTKSVYELRVCGYANSRALEASIELVSEIRGVAPGYYSFIVVKGSPEAMREAVKALGVEPSRQRLLGLVVALISRVGNETKISLHEALTEAYISDLGLQRDHVLYFAMAVSLASIAGSVMIGLDTSRRLRDVLRVYRLLGVSKRSLVLSSALVGLLTLIWASVVSIALYNYVDLFSLNLLGYTLRPSFELDHALTVYVALLVMYSAGLISGVGSEVE
jgi:hypothetical protein